MLHKLISVYDFRIYLRQIFYDSAQLLKSGCGSSVTSVTNRVLFQIGVLCWARNSIVLVSDHCIFLCFTEPCPRGRYFAREEKCTECPIGKYRDTDHTIECENCPEGMSTEKNGSVSIENCTSKCPQNTKPFHVIIGVLSYCKTHSTVLLKFAVLHYYIFTDFKNTTHRLNLNILWIKTA